MKIIGVAVVYCRSVLSFLLRVLLRFDFVCVYRIYKRTMGPNTCILLLYVCMYMMMAGVRARLEKWCTLLLYNSPEREIPNDRSERGTHAEGGQHGQTVYVCIVAQGTIHLLQFVFWLSTRFAFFFFFARAEPLNIKDTGRQAWLGR